MLGVSKIFGTTPEYVLYEMSYVNALMYTKATPMPGDVNEGSDRPPFDESKDACNPDNFADEDFEGEVVVRA